MEFFQLILSKSKLEDKDISRFTELVADKYIDINSFIVQFSDVYTSLEANALHFLLWHYKHDNLIDLVRIFMAENDIDINDQDTFGRNALSLLVQVLPA